MSKTMYDIVPRLIRPATVESRCSFAELEMPEPASYFVSHWCLLYILKLVRPAPPLGRVGFVFAEIEGPMGKSKKYM